MIFSSKAKILPKIFLSFLPVLMGLWLPFAHLFWLNSSNLTLPLSVHLPIIGLISLIAVCIGFALQTLTPPWFRQTISYFLLIFGVYLWAENTLFIGNFGFLQGEGLDWSGNSYLLYLELLLAGLLSLLVFKLGKRLINNAGWITLILLISSLANIFPAFQANQERTKTNIHHTFTTDQIFQLSPNKNVILFIIDTYQSDIFADIIAENPQWRDVFDGFTFFPNATSSFPKTYASIPNMLTGQAFDNSQPFSHYMHNAYLGNSAPKVLKENGFDVRYRSFTWQPYFAHPDVADNLAGIGDGSAQKWMQQNEFIQLVNLTLFRLSPFLAKPWVYNENEFRIRTVNYPQAESEIPYILTDEMRNFSKGNTVKDLEFLDQLTAFVKADSPKPTFRIYHLLGIHAKLKLNSKLEYIGKQPINPETFRDQAKGMLKLLALAFARLKQEGLYDNSLIFVVGDHGGGEYGKIQVLQEASNKIGLNVDFEPTKYSIENSLIRGAIPAILAKPINKNGSLKISSAPVQLSDIPNTIFSELGFSSAQTDLSIFNISDDADRPRFHRYYRFAGWGQDYIVPLTEYKISGFSWNPGSWSPSGRDLNSQAVESYQGQLIVMGKGGNLDKFSHQGWSTPLTQGRMMTGKRASITIPHQKINGTMLLEIRTKPQYSPEQAVPMAVLINDEKITTWTISQSSPFKFFTFIPDHLCQDETDFKVSFEIEEANTDPMIIEIRIIDDPGRNKITLGQTISFEKKGNGEPYLGSGWNEPESWGTWTDGFSSLLHMVVDSPVGEDLQGEVVFRSAIFPKSKPISVDVMANGKIIDSWFLDQKGSQKKTFSIPGHLIQTSRILDLGFSINNPRQPKNYSQSTDKRFMGLGMQSLTIRKAASVDQQFSDILARELLFSNEATTFRSGFNNTEDWNGKPVVWTKGMADIRMGVNHSNRPTAAQITIESALRKKGYLVACVNGVPAGASHINSFPWHGLLDLSEIPVSDQLRLVIYSPISVPAEANPVQSDSRQLGLALSSIKLTDQPLPDIIRGEESVLLQKPINVVLNPSQIGQEIWAGIQNSEILDGIPAKWIKGEATCTANWPHPQPPRFLLVDIARTESMDSTLKIEINGIPVLADFPIGNNWGQMIDITNVPPSGLLEISLTCRKPYPADDSSQTSEFKPSGLALRQIVLVQ